LAEFELCKILKNRIHENKDLIENIKVCLVNVQVVVEKSKDFK
jgi:hypothetical protein